MAIMPLFVFAFMLPAFYQNPLTLDIKIYSIILLILESFGFMQLAITERIMTKGEST